MATVRKKKTKKGVIYFLDVTHKGLRYRPNLGSNKKIAEQLAADYMLKLAKEDSKLFPTDCTIEVFNNEVTEYISSNLRKTTTARYKVIFDHFYKFLKKVFHSPIAQWLFKWIHPDVGVWLAQKWSKKSRLSSTPEEMGFKGKEGEWLWQYASELEQSTHFDSYIFGHRHLPLDLEVSGNSRYINLGEWVNHYTYAKHDGHSIELLIYSP